MASQKDIEDTLLYFLRNNNSKEAIRQNINSFKPSDWQRLYDLALDKGLYPVFYARLIDSPGIPPEFISKLKNIFLRNLRINIIMHREMISLIGCLKEKGVSVIPLKGPALAMYLYGDLALRRNSCDLDLLVKKENFEKAKALLEEIGYRADVNKQELKLKYDRQLRFVKNSADNRRLLLELHSDLRGLFTYSQADNLWDSVKEVDLNGNKVLMSANENLIVYLALTCMTITEFVELRYLYDMHIFISKFKNRISWDSLARRLNGHRHRACVFFALKLCKELFQTDIPQDFLDVIKPGVMKRLVLRLWINKKNVLRKWDYSSRGWYYFFTPWHYFISSYLYAQNTLDCARIIYRKIFPPLSDIAGIYNRRTSYLLYAKRLFKPVSHFFN